MGMSQITCDQLHGGEVVGYPSSTRPDPHRCSCARARISVGPPTWVRVKARFRSTTGLNGQIAQSVPAELPGL